MMREFDRHSTLDRPPMGQLFSDDTVYTSNIFFFFFDAMVVPFGTLWHYKSLSAGTSAV